MINLKLQLRASEIQPFANCVNRLFENCKYELDVTDYYNVRYFCKVLFDKIYRSFGSQSKKVTLTININVYDTLLRLYNMNESYLNNIENNFVLILYRDVVLQLNKQVVNLPGAKVTGIEKAIWYK